MTLSVGSDEPYGEISFQFTDVVHIAETAVKGFCQTVNQSMTKIKACTAAAKSFTTNIDYAAVAPLAGKVNRFCAEIEKTLNFTGSIPVIGAVSGLLRASLGKLQVIAGVALASISELGRFFALSESMVDASVLDKYDLLSKLGQEYLLHGCLNVLRGKTEMIIGTYTLGVGNLLFLIPNLLNGREFNPYYPYDLDIDKA